MSAWVTGGSAGTTRKFYNTGAGAPSSGVGEVYQPTASGGGSGVSGGTTPQPGVFSVNPLDPAGTVEKAKDPLTGLLSGLHDGLFGTSLPDPNGKHGGLLGDVPLAGDLLRAGSEGIAAVGGGIAEKVGQGIGGANDLLRRVEIGGPAVQQEVDQQYNDPGLQAWLKETNPETGKTNAESIGPIDKGFFDTGILTNEAHVKAEAIKQYAEHQQLKNPTLFGSRFKTPPTLADAVGFLFDAFGASADVVQRGVAGWDKADGQNQLDRIKAVGDGKSQWDTFSPENTPVEQLAYEKTKSGEWTDQQALDWLSSHGAGYSHDVRLQIAGTVGLDPLNIATFGAGAAAKVGLKGVETLAGAERASQLLDETRNALKAAEEAQAAAKGVRKVKAATAEVERLQGEVSKMEDAVKSFETYQSSGARIARTNVVARQIEGSQTVQDLLKVAGKAYQGLEGTYIGRAAKVTRTLIDPLHAMDLHMPGNARMVDLTSDALTKTLAETMGPTHYLRNFEDFRALDATGSMADQYARDLAVGMTNRGREGLLTMHQVSAVLRGLGKELAGTGAAALRDEAIDLAAKSVREKDLLGWLRTDATKNILRHNWTEAAHNDLARQLEAMYHGRTAAEWSALLPTMSKEQKSLLKLAAYGRSNSLLLDALSASRAAAHPSVAEFPLERIVLLAKTTLTRVGGESLLAQLGRAAKQKNGTNKALAILRDWQERYPELRYITIDEANPEKSLQQMVNYLEDHLDSMPMQVKADELAKMHPKMQDLASQIGDGYDLGFRPKDEFLWGVERGNAAGGDYVVKHAPWADHVGEGGLGYRPGRTLPTNISGMPIVGAPLAKAVKAVDYMEAGARTVMARVSGEQIHEVARQRFVSEAVRGDLAKHGLTEAAASKWWERLQSYTREHQGYSGPRGFGKGELYDAIAKEGLIPQTMLNGAMRLQPSDVLRMVMEAYDGDMRMIGLTQKLSGRAKRYLSAITGYNSNFAGQIAEHAWPTLKFRYHPMFQLQEKIEPWVLNTQRGIDSALTTNLSKADAATERLLQRLTDNSIIRHADLDQAEYSSQVLLGNKVGSIAKTPGSRMDQVTSMATQIMDVQGVKRINMLRTFRQGLGKELREAWDAARPGEWDQMLLDARGRTGRLISEDEFALQMMGENLFANDIVVSRLFKAGKSGGLSADWSNAIKPGAWHSPATLGELKPLDLDHVAASLGTGAADGRKIENLADLRRYIAEDHKRVDEVGDFLRRMGADKDYVSRVENSLTFSWEGFWKEAAQRYSLTTEESRALQDLVAGSAEVRGMTPVDYMSQVFHPGIIDGTEGMLGTLDKPLGILRRNKAGEVVGRGRTRLAGKAGETNREDLVRQLSAAFSAHLDPSAKRALLLEFKPELRKAVLKGEVKMDLADLKHMWDSGAEDDLANRILGYMDGRPGTGAHDVITDEARGIKSIREGADAYMRKNGVTPLGERRHYNIDEAHYEQTAAEYGALPETPFAHTGRRPTTKQVHELDTDLKPQPAAVDDRTYRAYQQFVLETKAQWDHMIAPKAQGGMGIKVTVAKGDPYTPDAAGRAAMQKDLAKGQLRVYGLDSDHPLMTNEQNVMFRAVHDVFGHSGEGFEFGPRGELNAAAAHFKMYSPEARGPLLTETHGQTSYVNYSNDIYTPKTAAASTPLDPANPADDFERRYPFEVPEKQAATLGPDDPREGVIELHSGEYGTPGYVKIDYAYDQKVGDGLRSLPTDAQEAILQSLADLHDQLPNMRIFHIDAVSFTDPLESPDVNVLFGIGYKKDAMAVTWGAGQNESVILFNRDKFHGDWKQNWEKMNRDNELGRQYDGWYAEHPVTKKLYQKPRQTMFGVAHNVGPINPASTARHEAGHAFDVARRPQEWNQRRQKYVTQRRPEYAGYYDMMARMEKEAGRLHLSEYGFTNTHEFGAELFSYATDPALVTANIAEPALRDMVEEFQKYLIDSGEWKPRAAAADPLAGKTIREVNAAKRGTVYAPQKAGLLPQATIDQFAQQFVGVGKHVESNPDVARVAQQFGKWSSAAVANGLLKGDKAVHAGLLNDIAGIPTHSAAPYNLTEGLAAQLAVQTMQDKWKDAFRLQYFAQERSMLERSINHPMFGLYPASYMWGKIMPEMIRFIAQKPFGIRTGGLAYSLTDAQAAIAMEREFNPEFDNMMEGLGHSQAVSLGGYLLPSLPWSISASAPTWMKDIASQGNRNAANVAAGKPVEDFNLNQPAQDVVSRLNPLETTIPWVGRAIDELNGPNTLKEQRALLVEQSGAAKASGISPTLAAIMAELQAELSK